MAFVWTAINSYNFNPTVAMILYLHYLLTLPVTSCLLGKRSNTWATTAPCILNYMLDLYLEGGWPV